MCELLYYPHPPGHSLEGFQRLVELSLGVLAGEDEANTGLALRNGGERDARTHDTFVEQRARELHRCAAFAHDDGSDGCLGRGRVDAADVESGELELILKVARVGPEALDALRLLLQDVERRNAGGGHRRRMRRGEQERAGAVVKIIDQVVRATDIAAQRADGF